MSPTVSHLLCLLFLYFFLFVLFVFYFSPSQPVCLFFRYLSFLLSLFVLGFFVSLLPFSISLFPALFTILLFLCSTLYVVIPKFRPSFSLQELLAKADNIMKRFFKFRPWWFSLFKAKSFFDKAKSYKHILILKLLYTLEYWHSYWLKTVTRLLVVYQNAQIPAWRRLR